MDSAALYLEDLEVEVVAAFAVEFVVVVAAATVVDTIVAVTVAIVDGEHEREEEEEVGELVEFEEVFQTVEDEVACMGIVEGMKQVGECRSWGDEREIEKESLNSWEQEEVS